ncbi:MAG: serine/threonine protein kinase, partial [Gemmatimonadetes bacterium]|nr:serine/threonine protein kinase [Gemmatimonadota bacterium]
MSSDHRLWDRWDEVDALLARALDQPIAEQVPFVRAECGDDAELADLVVRLLEVDAADGEPLSPSDSVLRGAFSDPLQAAAGPLVGSLAGAYRLVELIGRGGMGLVFRGERADGAFEREVAVKVFHRDPAVAWLADRFALERQILATLNHPGIAQMLDGGVTAEGRPFLVMELVDGVPIDRHARERRLGVDDKVRLVREVGEAVEHAHRHLVVHRDLKPSNILVTVEGPVKLLDFGIAKLLSPDPLDESGSVTRADRRFATPEYAAPEQLLGEPVSTLTDVYSLGALLYELLTGLRPYERREGESVLERMIRGDEPTAPSAAVVGSDRDGELSRSLGGDLDAILLRALQTRPESRYPSVGAFLDDLTRYLDGRPVVARGDARWYRARRFARRHRAALGAAGGVFLLLAGSATGLALQRAAV